MPPKTHDRQFATWQRVLLGALTCLLPFASLWFCQTATARQNQNPGREMLSAAGVGAELLATAKNGTLEAFPAAEFELFAALSEAILSFDAQPPTEKTSKFNLKQILQRPQQCRGDFVLVEGRVRRVTPIAIRSPPIDRAIGAKDVLPSRSVCIHQSDQFPDQRPPGRIDLEWDFWNHLDPVRFTESNFTVRRDPPNHSCAGFFYQELGTQDLSYTGCLQ